MQERGGGTVSERPGVRAGWHMQLGAMTGRWET